MKLEEVLNRIKGIETSGISQDKKSIIQKLLACAIGDGPKGRHVSLFGPQPVGLLRKDLPLITSTPYVASIKADGLRVMVFICSIPEPVVVLVDRCMNMVLIRAEIPARAYRYNGTLLDCELVESERCLYVFDTFCCYGCNMRKQNYLLRLNSARELFPEDNQSIPGLQIRIKPVFYLSDFERLIQLQETVRSDGIIFTAINEPIPFSNTCKTTFKYKPLPTVDLYLHRNCMLMWETEHGPDTVTVPQKTGLRVKTKGLRGNEGRVCEFTVDFSDGFFVLSFLRCRFPEKTKPNFYRVVESIFEEVVENITIEEIVQYIRKRFGNSNGDTTSKEPTSTEKACSHAKTGKDASPKKKNRREVKKRRSPRSFNVAHLYVPQELMTHKPLASVF